MKFFDSGDFEHDRERFQKEDTKQLEANRAKVAAIIATGDIAEGGLGRFASEHSGLALLQHEFGKKPKQKHLSIRLLAQRAGEAMLDLCPCRMMTPSAVAQFLKPGVLNFDVVIMDEASQLTPEDSWGAIARGRQLIVVGDDKQMPPSDFFGTSFDDEDSETEEEIDGGKSDSILDAAMPSLWPCMLEWHYRSNA